MKHPETNNSQAPIGTSSGFTLLQLLVVLVILGVLAAFLLPVITSARERAKRTECVSNLRQLSEIIQMYAQDHNGTYPGATWFYGSRDYMTESHFGLPATLNYSGVLWCPYGRRPHAGEQAIADCVNGDFSVPPPSSAGMCTIFFTNYIYNTSLINAKNGRGDIGKEEAELASESLFILSDGETSKYRSTGTSLNNCRDEARGYDYPTLHQKGGNYLFVDGHVKWMLPDTAADFQCIAAELLGSSKKL